MTSVPASNPDMLIPLAVVAVALVLVWAVDRLGFAIRQHYRNELEIERWIARRDDTVR